MKTETARTIHIIVNCKKIKFHHDQEGLEQFPWLKNLLHVTRSLSSESRARQPGAADAPAESHGDVTTGVVYKRALRLENVTFGIVGCDS